MKNRTWIQEMETRAYWNIRKGYRLRDAVQRQLNTEMAILKEIRLLKNTMSDKGD